MLLAKNNIIFINYFYIPNHRYYYFVDYFMSCPKPSVLLFSSIISYFKPSKEIYFVSQAIKRDPPLESPKDIRVIKMNLGAHSDLDICQNDEKDFPNQSRKGGCKDIPQKVQKSLGSPK